jgi:hypothetical protein
MLFDNLEHGHVNLMNLFRVGDESDRGLTLGLYLPGGIKQQRAAYLRYLSEAVDIAKLPLHEQRERLQQWEKGARSQPILVALLAPAISKVGEADRRSRAEVRCTVAALAAERYRQAKKDWPGTLNDLVDAGYLLQVPLDPYDAQPLRMKRTADGLVIYSVGADGQDNGGNVDWRHTTDPGTDLGFRLWDVAKRRQAPLPPRPKEPPPGDMPPGGDPGPP